MTKKRAAPTPKDCDDFADHVARRLFTTCRDHRRRFWKHLGYLVMLIGAVSGLLTLLVMLAERW